MQYDLTTEELRVRIEHFDFDRDEAISLFEYAITQDPDFQEAHRELGWALCGNGDEKNAEIHLRRAIELNPNDGWAHIYLGNLLWRRFACGEAETEFKTAVAVWPLSSIPYWCLAMYYDWENQFRQAGHYYRLALEIDPTDTVALDRYARFLRKRRQFGKARRIYKRLLELEPANEGAQRGLFEATLSSRSGKDMRRGAPRFGRRPVPN